MLWSGGGIFTELYFPHATHRGKTKTAKCLRFMCFVPRDHNISDEWSGSRLKLSLAWPGGSTYYTTGNIIRCRKDGWDCVFDERSSRMMFHRNSYQDLSLAGPSRGGNVTWRLTEINNKPGPAVRLHLTDESRPFYQTSVHPDLSQTAGTKPRSQKPNKAVNCC